MTPQLSDSQLVVLSTACQRPDAFVFPVTLKLKGNAIGNVLKSLLTKGLLEEIPGRADDTIWRYDDESAPLARWATYRSARRERSGSRYCLPPDRHTGSGSCIRGDRRR